MKTVLIYKTELLHPSETFIQAQAGALHSFRPQFAGLEHAAKSLPLPKDTIFAIDKGSSLSRWRLHAYRLWNLAPPGFFEKLQGANASLIHSHFATESITALPIAARLNLPLIVTLHGADITVHDSALRGSLGGRLYLRRRPQLWQRTSRFICVSNFIKQKAIAKGFPEDKLHVLYIGIDRSSFHPATRPRNPNSVLFVGRLTEKKGCQYLLQAMARVQKKHPQAELTIIGDGPLRSSLEDLAGTLRVNASFRGAQPSRVVREAMETARVFCAPSVTAANGDSEGLGMVFAEAQAMGLPVVSFDHAGMQEAIQVGRTGLLADERDSVKLAENILTYLKDDDFWLQSSRAGVGWIQQKFDLKTQTQKLEELYNEVISGFPRNSSSAKDSSSV